MKLKVLTKDEWKAHKEELRKLRGQVALSDRQTEHYRRYAARLAGALWQLGNETGRVGSVETSVTVALEPDFVLGVVSYSFPDNGRVVVVYPKSLLPS